MQTARHVNGGEEILPSENFGVMRLFRKVFNPYSTVGGIFTSRVGSDGNYNMAYGLDAALRLYKDDYLTIRWAQTFENNRPTLSSLKPDRIFMQWERRNDKRFSYDFSYNYSGEQYNPGIGLQLRDNLYAFQSKLQYGWVPGEKSKLYNHQLVFNGSNIYSVLNGQLESADYGISWKFITKKIAEGTFMIYRNYEDLVVQYPLSKDVYIKAGQYQFSGFKIYYGTWGTKLLKSGFNVDAGEFYDGYRLSLSAVPSWAVSHSLNIGGMYRFDRVDFNERNQRLRNHITSVNAVYDYSSKLSVAAYIQSNTAINGIISNFRLRYNPREGNDLYIVYNDMRNTQLTREYPKLPEMSYRAFLLKYVYTFIW
jgi:hypothetical protein